jgi:hypothetical protein
MKYHKINTLFKRDMAAPGKPLILGDWSEPEFNYLKENLWEFTEKVDGTNIRVNVDSTSITFGGRTDKAEIPQPLLERLGDIFFHQSDAVMDMFQEGAVLYGEGYVGKIQDGSKYRQDEHFVLFDVRVGPWWLKRDAVEDVARKLGLEVVPVIGTGTLYDAVRLAQDGFKSKWGDFEAEGIVARPKVDLLARSGNRIITKIKCCDFKGKR